MLTAENLDIWLDNQSLDANNENKPNCISFHCCIENYHKLGGLKQYTLLISQFLCVKSYSLNRSSS